MNLKDSPHRRYNPLAGEWVKVSPHRTQRPWDGQVEKGSADMLPKYDPGCYLCPGNTRAGGVKNPDYTGTFVFDNDFAALLPAPPSGKSEWKTAGGLLKARAERGICRVLCFSPRHDLTLARMDTSDITGIVRMWIGQYLDLVPFWATWPYEVLLLPRRHLPSIAGLSSEEIESLASIIRKLGIRYDNLFSTSFPYSMGIHQAPTDGRDHPEVHVHFHYFPPLLRSATIKKFMVGYELLAMAQRDITPELSAETLRRLPDSHYLERQGETPDFETVRYPDIQETLCSVRSQVKPKRCLAG